MSTTYYRPRKRSRCQSKETVPSKQTNAQSQAQLLAEATWTVCPRNLLFRRHSSVVPCKIWQPLALSCRAARPTTVRRILGCSTCDRWQALRHGFNLPAHRDCQLRVPCLHGVSNRLRRRCMRRVPAGFRRSLWRLQAGLAASDLPVGLVVAILQPVLAGCRRRLAA